MSDGHSLDHPPPPHRSHWLTIVGLLAGLFAGCCPGSIIAMAVHDLIYLFVAGIVRPVGDTFSMDMTVLAVMGLATVVGGVCGAVGTGKVARIAIRLCTPPKRFSLRSLFLFTACVALVLSVTVVPLVRARGFNQERKLAAQELLALGAQIGWRSDASPGLDGVDRVSFDGQRVGEHAAKRAIPTLLRCRNLCELDLSYSSVADAEISELAVLGALETIDLVHTRISDRSATSLTQMTKLWRIDASNTSLTDSGVRELARLPKLHVLRVRNTQVTEEGVRELQKTRPGIVIEY